MLSGSGNLPKKRKAPEPTTVVPRIPLLPKSMTTESEAFYLHALVVRYESIDPEQLTIPIGEYELEFPNKTKMIVQLKQEFDLTRVNTINVSSLGHFDARALYYLLRNYHATNEFKPYCIYLVTLPDINDPKKEELYFFKLSHAFHRNQIHTINPSETIHKAEDIACLNYLLDNYVIENPEKQQQFLSRERIYSVPTGNSFTLVRLPSDLAAYPSRKGHGTRFAVEDSALSDGSGAYGSVSLSKCTLIRENGLFRRHVKDRQKWRIMKKNRGKIKYGGKIINAITMTIKEGQITSRFVQMNVKGVASDGSNNESILIERYIEGETLLKFLQKEYPCDTTSKKFAPIQLLSVPLLAKLSRMLFEGIKEIHRMGVVHRDVKPENLIVKFRYRPGITKLEDVKALGDIIDIESVTFIDFNLSKSAEENDVGSSVGSPLYAPIEVYTYAGTDNTSDTASLIRTLWALWGSHHLYTLKESQIVAYFTNSQNDVPGLFTHKPIPDAQLDMEDKQKILNLFLRHSDPNKQNRPQKEEEAIELFAQIEKKYANENPCHATQPSSMA